MCRGEVELRERQKRGDGAAGGRIDLMRYKSPSIVLPRLEEMGKQIKVLQKKNYRHKEVKKC